MSEIFERALSSNDHGRRLAYAASGHGELITHTHTHHTHGVFDEQGLEVDGKGA